MESLSSGCLLCCEPAGSCTIETLGCSLASQTMWPPPWTYGATSRCCTHTHTQSNAHNFTVTARRQTSANLIGHVKSFILENCHIRVYDFTLQLNFNVKESYLWNPPPLYSFYDQIHHCYMFLPLCSSSVMVSLFVFQIVLFLSVFENLTFCPSALMEAFAQKVISNPDALTLRELLCIIKVYSSLNYDLQRHRPQ